MIKIFETLEKYNTYTNNGQNLESGDLYYVKEDNSTHYLTNNIDGVTTIYDAVETPSGNIEITENGEDIDIAQYATATVDVPIPEGYIIPTGNKSITANGENIDVNDYATASVNVPVPPEYIIPTGNKSITENGTNIDVAQYATATVNVPSLDPSDMINLIERDITSLEIPSGTTTIGTSALSNCSGLTSVTIPDSVTTIGQSSFNSCTGLTSVTIPDSVTFIGTSALSNCSGLTSVTIPDSVTSIGQLAFANCTGLTSVTIGNGVTTITPDVFNRCTSLKRVNSNVDGECIIPNSVTSISNGNYNTGAFGGCTSLTTVTIPNSVRSIGSWAFYGCTGLTSVTVQATTPPTLSNGNAFGNTNNCPIYVPAESVDTYKAASGWSTLASRIQTIPTT